MEIHEELVRLNHPLHKYLSDFIKTIEKDNAGVEHDSPHLYGLAINTKTDSFKECISEPNNARSMESMLTKNFVNIEEEEDGDDDDFAEGEYHYLPIFAVIGGDIIYNIWCHPGFVGGLTGFLLEPFKNLNSNQMWSTEAMTVKNLNSKQMWSTEAMTEIHLSRSQEKEPAIENDTEFNNMLEVVKIQDENVLLNIHDEITRLKKGNRTGLIDYLSYHNKAMKGGHLMGLAINIKSEAFKKWDSKPGYEKPGNAEKYMLGKNVLKVSDDVHYCYLPMFAVIANKKCFNIWCHPRIVPCFTGKTRLTNLVKWWATDTLEHSSMFRLNKKSCCSFLKREPFFKNQV